MAARRRRDGGSSSNLGLGLQLTISANENDKGSESEEERQAVGMPEGQKTYEDELLVLVRLQRTSKPTFVCRCLHVECIKTNKRVPCDSGGI